MKTFILTPRILFLAAMTTVTTALLHAQQLEPLEPAPATQNQVTAESSPPTPTPSTAPAFSADKFERTIRITPDGKQVTLSENRPMKIARGPEGQIRAEAIGVDEECQKSAKASQDCTSSAITLFDPTTQTVTHWGERSNNAHASVVFPITPSRAAEIEEDTTSIPDESGSLDSEGATVTTKDLGQKTIEGISATGFRTTVTLPARARGNKNTITTIHEVWTSTEMNLVVQVIDAQTTGSSPITKEAIHGLDHVSLNPEPSLFHPPDDYDQQDYRVTNPGKSNDRLAESDIPQYAAWFVK